MLAGTRAAEGGLNSLSRSAAAAGAGIDRSARRAGQSWVTAGKHLDRAGKKMSAGGRVMTRNVTLPILAAGAASVKMAVDFDTSMRAISALVGASDAQMTQYREGILDLAREVPQAPKELAEALYFVTSSGFEGAAALDVLNASARAAATGLAETQTMADVVTSAVNAYGEENLSAARSVDIMLAAVREGKVEGEQFAQSIGRIIPLGAELGVSFDQVAGALAAMSLSGLDAAEGTTALRGIFTQILKPAAMSEEALKKIGLSAQGVRDSLGERGLLPTLLDLKARLDLSDQSLAAFNKTMDEKGALAAVRKFKDENEGVSDALGKLFPNVRALAGFLNLVGRNADKNAQAIAAVGDSVGDTDEALAKAAKGDRFKFQQQLNKLRVAAIELGEDLLPVAHDIVEMVGGMAEAFGSLDAETRQNIIKLAAALMLLGPATRVLGGLASVAGLSARGIGALIRALSGAGAASAGASALGGSLGTLGAGAGAAGTTGALTGQFGRLAVQGGAGGLDRAAAGKAAATSFGAAFASTLGSALAAAGLNHLMDTQLDKVEDSAEDKGGSIGRVLAESVRNALAKTMPGGEVIFGDLDKITERRPDQRARISAEALADAYKVQAQRIMGSVEAFEFHNRVQRRAVGITDAQRDTMGNLIRRIYATGAGLDQTTQNQIEHAAAAGNAKGAIDILNGALERNQAQLDKARGKVDGFVGALGKIPPHKGVRVTADTSQAEAAIARLRAMIASLGVVDGFVGATAGGGGGGPSGGSAQPRAAGGPVLKGLAYLVGEKGPEIIVPKTPGFVLPNHKLRTTTPGTGVGGGTGRGAMRIKGTLDTPFGPSEVRGIVTEEIEANESYNEGRERVNR